MARTKTQRSKRQFETRREGLMRKINQMNCLTTARVALVGIYKGRTFSYEPEEGLLQRFGLAANITECFGSDDIVRSERMTRTTSPKVSISSDYTSTDPSCESSLESPVGPLFRGKPAAAPQNMSLRAKKIICGTDRKRELCRRWRRANIDQLNVDFFQG